MSTHDTGGPAFPGPCTKPLENYYPGLTVRDYFAAKAMQAFANKYVYDNYEVLADRAYALAAAMLAERDK